MTGEGKDKGGAGSSGRGRRDLRVRVKTAKGRKLSSTLWLERQLNDPYVARAKAEGYRSRAAFKLIEIDDRFGLLRPGARVVDLGCAPGGWVQVALARTNALGERKGRPVGRVVGVDLNEVEPIVGAELMLLDFLEEGADMAVREVLGGPADVVLSDMAAPASGHPQTDNLRITALCRGGRGIRHGRARARRRLRRQGAGGRRRSRDRQAAPSRLRQGPARQAAGEPQGLVGEVPRRHGVPRPAGVLKPRRPGG